MMKSDSNYASFLESASEAAVAGGKILKKYWGKLKNITEKRFQGDLVTEADQESDDAILAILKKRHSSHSILSEEHGLHGEKHHQYCWVVDPLDGTTNYTHQYPFVAVSIGLLHHGKPIIGVVYNPIINELFVAAKGEGAFLNGTRIHVSKVNRMPKALLGTGFAYDRRETFDNNYTEFCYMTHLSQGVRRCGSAALDLAFVAAGRLDGFWERGLNPWDIAAGIILIQEAGGIVTSYEGEELILDSGRILGSNGLIHEQLIAELKNANQSQIKIHF